MDLENENKLTVEQHCTYLGWPIAELSRQAGISWERASFAYNRSRSVSDGIKRAIVAALSKARGEKINVGDIQWEQPQR